MKFKIYCTPGDHRDDFKILEGQLNEWAATAKPEIVDLHMDVTAMSDPKNVGRYLMSVLVSYENQGGDA